MNLQTNIPFKKQSNNLIDYNSKVLLLGSCFSENIGKKFHYYKFQSLINPFGILFHPLAIERLITNAINEKIYTEEDLFFHNEQWHCFEAHSKLSNPSKEELLKDLNENVKSTIQQIKSSTHIIITLGTAWTYRHIETDRTVANCHKVPQKKFLKELLSVDEITQSLEAMVSLVKSVNPDVKFIFTVSPVRHLKDGFVENQQSKAHLISAIHSVLSSRALSRDFCYFPSYEIQMDELRDYRFYADDMIHPNQIAVNYIWNKFQDVWISEEAISIMDEVETIQRGLAHKSFNPNSEAHQKFLQNLLQKQKVLQQKIPHLSF